MTREPPSTTVAYGRALAAQQVGAVAVPGPWVLLCQLVQAYGERLLVDAWFGFVSLG